MTDTPTPTDASNQAPTDTAPTQPVQADPDYAAFQAWKAAQANAATVEDDSPEEVYVWLADGSVERAYLADAPIASGTNAPFGHFTRDGKSYVVVGVYPVETKVGA